MEILVKKGDVFITKYKTRLTVLAIKSGYRKKIIIWKTRKNKNMPTTNFKTLNNWVQQGVVRKKNTVTVFVTPKIN